MGKVVAKMMIMLSSAFFAACLDVYAAEPAANNISAVIKEIDEAKSEILVQSYSLASKNVAESLTNAHRRGVHTQIILDKSGISQEDSVADYTHNMGIPTYIDDKNDIAENRIIIIDRGTVITDTFNFIKAAGEKRAGNLLILKSRELADMYIDDWNRHRKHSKEYAGRQ